ncbi:signal transduction histidine kinase [Bacteroides reticulotermitis]|uniref:histidine kinase n=1 Tax=Bacteroides reticulotermitis TaxID=1133319 RepID=A0A840D1L7_9BACE|nr:ATP-binding protein [Bacteroides reticulotermitis]MBB4044941.1 signal transduction histidine kinase [Bacteroides reticulotermitis]
MQLTSKNVDRERDKLLFSIYKRLSQAYEKHGNYKEALKYDQLKDKVESRISDSQKYHEIKELNIKYETAEKELEISRLNKEFEAAQYRRILSITGFLLLTMLLATLFLYERTKKLKKSREALLMADRMKQKDLEHQAFYNETKQCLVRNYLDGLEAERIRLARELHDNVSNQLVVLKMEIERREKLHPIAQSVADLHTEVRNISHGLMPPVFQYATLSEIIKDYVYQQNLKGNILFTAVISPEDYNWETVPSELSIEVYRILQEAIGNAIRHAETGEVDIVLKVVDGILMLDIADNGKGFVVGEQKAGLGLRIIEERAEAINGTLEIQSEINKGTVVKLQVAL